ncbi:hypothetical protein TYRP_015390 [Tyrophagus putrescentiae]|nr:hypothetical protein TYRP_015390 [Tyrophagus putrescentiae]
MVALASQALLSVEEEGKPTSSSKTSCKAHADCTHLNGICFKGSCLCPLGFRMTPGGANGSCKAYLCDVHKDIACDQWAHASCGPSSQLCYCSSGFRLDEYHLQCEMSGTTIALIVFVSIFGVLMLVFCCCSCFEFVCCLSLFPAAVVEETTIIVSEQQPGKQKKAIKEQKKENVSKKELGKSERSTKKKSSSSKKSAVSS